MDSGRHAASAELVELLGGRNGEDTDDSALFRSCSQQCTFLIHGYARQRGLVCGNDLDFLHVIRIEKHDISTHGFWLSGACRRDVCRGRLSHVFLLAHGVGDVVVRTVWRESANGIRVRGSDELAKQLHGRNIVDEDEVLHDDEKTFTVELEGADPRREGELAYGGLAFCVDDAQMARRQDHGNERGREEHLEDGNVAGCAILGEWGLEQEGEGIGRVDAHAIRGRDGQEAMVLVEGDVVQRHGGRGARWWVRLVMSRDTAECCAHGLWGSSDARWWVGRYARQLFVMHVSLAVEAVSQAACSTRDMHVIATSAFGRSVL